jgi:hypothetical protein
VVTVELGEHGQALEVASTTTRGLRPVSVICRFMSLFSRHGAETLAQLVHLERQ